MATLKELFDVLHESTELSSGNELKLACELIERLVNHAKKRSGSTDGRAGHS